MITTIAVIVIIIIIIIFYVMRHIIYLYADIMWAVWLMGEPWRISASAAIYRMSVQVFVDLLLSNNKL